MGITTRGLGLFAIAFVVCAPSLATAEIVRLANGRTLSVRGHQREGDRIRLLMRGGGEIVCPAALVAAVMPDELPEPELAAAGTTAQAPDATLPVPISYKAIIDGAAERHRVDARLLHAMIRVESSYHARARSRRGALGLMQLMPATARQYGVSDPYDPAENVDAGARHLRGLLDRFELRLALAAYNAGEAAVRRFGGVPPYDETRSYVARVLALAGR